MANGAQKSPAIHTVKAAWADRGEIEVFPWLRDPKVKHNEIEDQPEPKMIGSGKVYLNVDFAQYVTVLVLQLAYTLR